jgi:chromate transporter
MRREPETASGPSLAEALPVWLQIGIISVGGPAAQIGLLHEMLVRQRRWIAEPDFETALNFCMLLPGPEAQQLATFLGWRLHGARGAFAAGGLFILPGAFVMLALAWLAASQGQALWLQGALSGMLPVVVALVALAVRRLASRSLKSPAAVGIALGAFAGLTVLQIDFPWIIGLAAVAGLMLRGRLDPALATMPQATETATETAVVEWWPLARRTAGLTAVFAVLWLAPVAAIVALAGPKPFADIADVFTRAALVTFGGAYAVIPYVAKAAVNHHHWLTQTDMLHGLALAETTPGPLILINQYAGFFAGWNAALAGQCDLSPSAAGILAAALTTWTTFLPCFYFVLCGAPAVQALSGNRHMRSALGGVSCAVVGIIATLGLAAGQAAFWPGGRLDPIAVATAAAALLVLVWGRLPTPWLVAAAAMAGAVRSALWPGIG